uniref:Uncharacterized protein n=1 Tax=viral metagenome TaxID=1070528 RepID=A0A6M3KTI0_9ZZZZ
MVSLEGAKAPEAEVVEPTQDEGAKQTEPKGEPTVGKTYTEEEFRHELDKAVGKSTVSLQQQVSLTKQQLKAIEAERDSHKSNLAKMDEDIKFLENKLHTVASDKFGGDEEAIAGFKDTLSLEIERRKFQRDREALDKEKADRDAVTYAQMLERKALDLQKKYQVPSDLLEMCTTEEQMDKLAKAFPEVTEKPPAEETPKFDSGQSSGGTDLSSLSARELLVLGEKKKRK